MKSGTKNRQNMQPRNRNMNQIKPRQTSKMQKLYGKQMKNTKNTKKMKKVKKSKTNKYKPQINTSWIERNSSIKENFVNATNINNDDGYASNISKRLNREMNYRQYIIHNVSNSHVYSVSKNQPSFSTLNARRLVKNEYALFVSNISEHVLSQKNKMENKRELESWFNRMLYNLGEMNVSFGYIIFNAFGKKSNDFLIQYLSKLKSKPGNKSTGIFHMTFHKKSIESIPSFGQRENGVKQFVNTGSIHIIADHEIVSCISGLKYDTRIVPGTKKNPFTILSIDDTDIQYNPDKKIEKGELLARIKVGIVKIRVKYVFQILSFNYHPYLNNVFFNEIVKTIHAFNTFTSQYDKLDLSVKDDRLVQILSPTRNIEALNENISFLNMEFDSDSDNNSNYVFPDNDFYETNSETENIIWKHLTLGNN